MDYAEQAYQNDQLGQEESHQVSFRRIEELEQFGVNKTDITKLKAGGYHTIESVRCLLSIHMYSLTLIIPFYYIR